MTAPDQRLLALARRGRSPNIDSALVTLTRAANYSRLWLGAAAVIGATGGPRGRLAARRGLAALALASAVANGPIKLAARRRRPPVDVAPSLVRMPRSTSFPSGHSASAFAFATGASLEQPALGIVLVPLAGAVAYSRVHAGVHYPSDVAAGAAVGVGCALLLRRFALAKRGDRPPAARTPAHR
ncbi:MAG TPA: phosphatase PAP2 family protein [Solirubrobacteraceae bacterium]|nr:phosphatase PAP2 family protein [Solirubrobacteraceae bacterium]